MRTWNEGTVFHPTLLPQTGACPCQVCRRPAAQGASSVRKLQQQDTLSRVPPAFLPSVQFRQLVCMCVYMLGGVSRRKGHQASADTAPLVFSATSGCRHLNKNLSFLITVSLPTPHPQSSTSNHGPNGRGAPFSVRVQLGKWKKEGTIPKTQQQTTAGWRREPRSPGS